MKKIARLLIATIVFVVGISSIALAQGVVKKGDKSDEWISDKDNPVKLLERIHYEANDEAGNRVQVTPLNRVNSKGYHCDINTQGNFTLARTFCSIKHEMRGYLQYIMYIGLAGATIFIVRNGFLLVTATDKEGQMKAFTKNMKNLIIGIILLTSFFFILDVFVSVINFISGE